MHSWLARYEAEVLDGLRDRSHRPAVVVSASEVGAGRGRGARAATLAAVRRLSCVTRERHEHTAAAGLVSRPFGCAGKALFRWSRLDRVSSRSARRSARSNHPVAVTAQDSDVVLDSDRHGARGYRRDRRDSLGQQWKPTGCGAPDNLLDIGCATLHAATIGGTPAFEAGSYDAATWVDTNRWPNRPRTREVARSSRGSRHGGEPAPSAAHRRSLRSTALVCREHRPTRQHHSLVLGHCPRPSPDRGRTLLPDRRSSRPGQPGHHHPAAGSP